jgi:hypothetical protein
MHKYCSSQQKQKAHHPWAALNECCHMDVMRDGKLFVGSEPSSSQAFVQMPKAIRYAAICIA